MNIVLGPVGPSDDFYSMLALGVELKKRGHWVSLCAPEEFRSVAYKNDFKMFSCGSTYKKFLHVRNDENSGSELPEKLSKDMAEHFVSMRDALREAHILVASALPLAGPSVAQQFGVKYCYTIFQPSLLDQENYPALGVPFKKVTGWMGSVRRSKLKSEWGEKVLAALNRERGFSGSPPVNDLHSYLFKPEVRLMAIDPLLTRQDEKQTTGFWFDERESTLPDDVEKYLNAGSAPVFLADLGIPIEEKTAFLSAFCDVMLRDRKRVLVSAEWPDIPGSYKCDSQQYEGFFQHLSAVVHAGSHRIAANAMRAGIPQVVFPFTVDQHDLANRLQAAGIGTTVVDLNSVTEAVSSAKSKTGEVRLQNGVAAAADAIEKM